MTLTPKQVRHLRALAHGLDPAARVGKDGVGEPFVKEVARNLSDFELIKVRLEGDDRGEFEEAAEGLAAATNAALVQTIGRIAVLYRPAEEPKIRLP